VAGNEATTLVNMTNCFLPRNMSSNNGPVSVADIENETIVNLVDAGVAVMTRMQSE
jgi:hypothetical protein